MYVSLGIAPKRLGQISPEVYAALDPQAKAILAKVVAATKAVRGVSGLRGLRGLGNGGGSNRLMDFPLGWLVFWGHAPVYRTTHHNFNFALAVRQGQGTNPTGTTAAASPANPAWMLSDEATGIMKPMAETGAGYKAPGGSRMYAMTGSIFGKTYPVLVIKSWAGPAPALNITPNFKTWGLDNWLMWVQTPDAHYPSVGWQLPDPVTIPLNADEQFLYKLFLLDNILLRPTPDEVSTLQLLDQVIAAGFGQVPSMSAPGATMFSYALFIDPDGRWNPVQSALATGMVGSQLRLLQNMKVLMDAVEHYPWPGEQQVRFWYQVAWRERNSGIIPPLMRSDPPLTPDEAKTAITVTMLANWQDVTTRVGALAQQQARSEAREAAQLQLAITVFSVVVGAMVGGLIIPAIISAGTKTLSAVETARLKSDLANLSNSMQADSPGFAAEVNRVSDMIAAKEAAEAAAAAAAAPGAQVEMLAPTTSSHTGLYIGIAVAGAAILGGTLFLVLRKRKG